MIISTIFVLLDYVIFIVVFLLLFSIISLEYNVFSSVITSLITESLSISIGREIFELWLMWDYALNKRNMIKYRR